MEPQSSSPKRARADDAFDIPSPKRNCLDTESALKTAGASTPDTPFDDMHDLYGTPNKSPHSAQDPPSKPPIAMEPTQNLPSLEAKKAVHLPGLGQPYIPGEQDDPVTAADAGNVNEPRNHQESPVEHNGKGNISHEPQVVRVVDDSRDFENASPISQDSAEHSQEAQGQLSTNVAQVQSSSASAPTAMTTPAVGIEQQTTTAPTETIGGPDSFSRLSSLPANIDVASLSEDLPPVTLDKAGTRSRAQTSSGEQSTHEIATVLPEPRSVDQSNGERTALVDPSNEILKTATEANPIDEQPEFEMDSSPLESSSSESSSDSSSSDGSDGYVLLSPAEQARRLMQEDMGSDDEGAGKGGKGTLSGPLRTTNEKPDEIVPKPNLVVTEDMKIHELGEVECTVQNEAVIKGRTSGEYQVLENGSILCLQDRSVIGVIADTWGRVQQPYYSIRFTNVAAIADAGIYKGTQIFYVESHSTTVFTQPLKAYKGSDASNLHDEEVGDDEMEFSDDEKEAEHKRRVKQAKQARRDGRPADGDGFSRGAGRGRGDRGRSRGRGGRPPPERSAYDAGAPISYDDMEVDGPYNPLARPTNLHEMMGRNEAPIEPLVNGNSAHSGAPGGRHIGPRGRGRGLPRGDRGRGNRDRRDNQRNEEGYGSAAHGTAPPYPYGTEAAHTPSAYGHTPQPNPYAPAQSSFQQGYTPSYAAPLAHTNPFDRSGYNQHSSFQHQPFQNQTQLPHIPPGAYINPAFFAQSPERNQYSASNAQPPK